MRPVVKGATPTEADSITNKIYSPYSNAKDDLADVIGDYCSFCETWGTFSSIAVEHVQAKKYTENGVEIYAHLEEVWDNFLLACVHCNSIKGSSNVILNNYHLPHLTNTFLCIDYGQGGIVTIASELNEQERIKVNNLISLVGLDRRPGKFNYSRKDRRWKNRRAAWELAEKYFLKYNSGNADVDTICDLASQRGFWSVWMKVFTNNQVVKMALIRAFIGTFPTCETTDLYRN
jgi:hypothetical protein